MMESRQQKDLELWEQWKRTKNTRTLGQLMTRLNPLIHREVNKWQYTVPPAALMSKGRLLTVDALKTYNPNKGAAIGTHVTSRLRKLSRFAYPMQNVARMPENKQLLFNTFEGAKGRLYDELGREPTVEEMSDELAWSRKKVQDFQRSFGRRELVESEGAFQDERAEEAPLVDFYYHGLPPDDKLLFEDITGYGGNAPMKNAALGRKYKLTQGQLSYKKRKFTEQIKSIQSGKI
jgi:DNA-directed RNA polymerase specialized sigma subunit